MLTDFALLNKKTLVRRVLCQRKGAKTNKTQRLFENLCALCSFASWRSFLVSPYRFSSCLSSIARCGVTQNDAQSQGLFLPTKDIAHNVSLDKPLLKNKLHAHEHSAFVLLFTLHRMNPILEVGYARTNVQIVSYRSSSATRCGFTRMTTEKSPRRAGAFPFGRCGT